MKKLIALLLALVMVTCLFAACGNAQQGDNSQDTEPTSTEPTETEPATTEPEANVAEIKKLSKHENGWMQVDFSGNEDSQGVYFNSFANDAPYAEDWSLRYTPTENASVILVRDGEQIDITQPGAEMIVKYGNTSYYLAMDKWLLGDDVFPVTNGDMIILEGDFMDPTGEWTIRFLPQYIVFDNDMAKFYTEDPTAEG